MQIYFGNISLWAYLPKIFKGIKVKNINLVQQIPAIILLFIPQIANKVYNMLDTTMLGNLIADKSETGFYESAQKIMRVLITIATALGTVMVPRMANMFANGKKEKITEYLKKSFHFTFLLCFPMIFGIIATSRDFVPLFFGDGYSKVIILMNIISPIVLLIGIANIFGSQYLLPTKRQKEYTISVLIGIVVNLILNYIMINLWQSVGACIATIISELVVVIVQAHFLKNEINLKELFKISYVYLFASIIMFICCMFVRLLCSGFVCLVIQVIVAVLVYFVILLIFKNEFLYLLIGTIRKKLSLKSDITNEKD